MNDVREYFQRLVFGCGTGWNRFWFAPRDSYTLCVLRILTGVLATYFVASFSADLTRWFSPHGILSASTSQQLTGSDQIMGSFRFSYLYLAQSPLSLWVLHAIGLGVLLAFTIGLWSRVMNVAALIVVLSYVHRGPILTGPFEPVLTMLLSYLCLGSTGRYLSIDSWLARRGGARPASPSLSTASNISTRLIQLHLAGLCGTIGLNMLAGDVWWSGEALWWLLTRSESRLIDLTGLGHAFIVVNIWTHSIVAYQLLFSLLIWNRLARPLILCLGILVWIPLALVTGWVAWSVAMLVASVAFISPEQTRRLAGVAST